MLRDDTQSNFEKFKQQCKIEINEWKSKIQSLKGKLETDSNTNVGRLSVALEQANQEWKRKEEIIAATARNVLRLRLELDQYPSMSELSQYQRRINELKAISSQKHNDLLKCQQLNVSLQDSDSVLLKENELFNSVLKSLQQALKEKEKQKALIALLKDSEKKSTQSRNEQTEKLKKQREVLKENDKKYRDLLEKQRRYFQNLKEYQEAVDYLDELQNQD